MLRFVAVPYQTYNCVPLYKDLQVEPVSAVPADTTLRLPGGDEGGRSGPRHLHGQGPRHLHGQGQRHLQGQGPRHLQRHHWGSPGGGGGQSGNFCRFFTVLNVFFPARVVPERFLLFFPSRSTLQCLFPPSWLPLLVYLVLLYLHGSLPLCFLKRVFPSKPACEPINM
jgi:hypothetical protein